MTAKSKEVALPQISPDRFRALPLRAHALLANVPLHDVWEIDLPRLRPGLTLDRFLEYLSSNDTAPLPKAARALFRFRFTLGRLFRLEAHPRAFTGWFEGRLTPEDRARSSIAPGTRDGLFRVVYRFENEQLLEVRNRTVHAAALSALEETDSRYRFYFAVYVAEISWITPVYMALIDPFRRWIVYPALLETIRKNWIAYATS